MLLGHRTHKEMNTYRTIFMLSAWSFAIVISSFLFLYIGYRLDNYLGTAPNFMFGLFFLALVTTIGRLYQEAWQRRKLF